MPSARSCSYLISSSTFKTSLSFNIHLLVKGLDRGMLGNDWTVDGVRRHINILGGLGRLHSLRSVSRSDGLRRGRGGLESASRLSRGLGIIILSKGDTATIRTGALIAAIDPRLEAGAKINQRERIGERTTLALHEGAIMLFDSDNYYSPVQLQAPTFLTVTTDLVP